MIVSMILCSSVNLFAQEESLKDTLNGIDYDFDPIPTGGSPFDPPPYPPPPRPFESHVPYTPPKLIGGYWSIIDSLSYPEEAMLAQLEGVVEVEVTIDHLGEISIIRVLSGDPIFEQSALQAVNSTKWIPAEQRGKSVKVKVLIPVVFKLDSLFIPRSFLWDEGIK